MAVLQHALGTTQFADGEPIATAMAAGTRGAPTMRDPARNQISQDRLVGLLVMTLLPATFWPGLLALAGFAWGAPFELSSLVLIGSSIAAFLAVVCTAMTRQMPVPAAVRPVRRRRT